MNKNKNNQKFRSDMRFILYCALAAIGLLCIKKDNLFQFIKSRITISRQNQEIKANDILIKQLDKSIYTLTNDRDSLEKYARENFNFAQKGDDVYIVE